ncbi:hypothetical protein AB0F25_36585 [Streptomyces wedmorensis]|uniref:hypothetical protein n=1 Tax=Streptomyces wedmorensis TaxID=43759 RepID=UPI003416BEA0
MGEGLTLASKWDTAIDIALFFRMVIFGHLPEWLRHPLLAAGLAGLVHVGLGWLRTRFGESPDEDEPVQELDVRVR